MRMSIHIFSPKLISYELQTPRATRQQTTPEHSTHITHAHKHTRPSVGEITPRPKLAHRLYRLRALVKATHMMLMLWRRPADDRRAAVWCNMRCVRMARAEKQRSSTRLEHKTTLHTLVYYRWIWLRRRRRRRQADSDVDEQRAEMRTSTFQYQLDRRAARVVL